MGPHKAIEKLWGDLNPQPLGFDDQIEKKKNYLDHSGMSATQPTFNTKPYNYLLLCCEIRSLTPMACSCSGLAAQSVEQQ